MAKHNYLIVDFINNKCVDRINAANGKSALKQFLLNHAMTSFDTWECAKIAGTYRIYKNETGQHFAAVD